MIKPPSSNHYIDLERSFHELAKYAREREDFDLTKAFFVGPPLHWESLLSNYRTVILSEAGTGKTEEIRQVAVRLRSEGKNAFFLRLEHIPEDFEDAFEVGTFEEFSDWLASPDEAWLVLDSVDEARLRHPGDFERAVRKLGRRLQSVFDRVHIVVTGRTSAWRPKTDLAICEQHLPGTPNTTRVAVLSHDDEFDFLSVDSDEDVDDATIATEESRQKDMPSTFQIVALDDLTKGQVELFATARGVPSTAEFLDEIERADAESFTSRPQDLAEVVDFWLREKRIGSRLELMRNSVQRRLEEPHQNHREAHPLAITKAREGARLLAAASVLCRDPTIQVPDGAHNNKGIAIQLVLSDWSDTDQATLISRPIFDEAIYGTVRFHHRSVREYLAAEWLTELLAKSTSRREIESLLFRTQYGVEVAVPTMRPVLPWLAILDERIREKVRKIAPEILFEGGDPSALPLPVRREILKEVCEQLATGKSARSALDYSSVQRFANKDLAQDIGALLKEYADKPELVSFLVRMVWLGRLEGLSGEVKALALSPKTPHYTRSAALRAMNAVSSDAEINEVREAFLAVSASLDRDWLNELLVSSKSKAIDPKWVLAASAMAEPRERFSVDTLTDSLAAYVENPPQGLLRSIVEEFNRLLGLGPFIERAFCEVSVQNAWMIKAAARGVERLIRSKDPAALEEPSLDILFKFRSVREWDDELKNVKTNFSELVPAWPELNHAAFWHDVHELRKSLSERPDYRVINFWQASIYGAAWEFSPDDFDAVADRIAVAELQDDKLVALSLAFDLYLKGNRPVGIERLKELVKGNSELEERLSYRAEARRASERRKEVAETGCGAGEKT
jgi:hypothetical protein